MRSPGAPGQGQVQAGAAGSQGLGSRGRVGRSGNGESWGCGKGKAVPRGLGVWVNSGLLGGAVLGKMPSSALVEGKHEA